MFSIKNVKWLINLADTKPLLFSIALLLGACSILALAVQNRQARVSTLEFERRLIINYYEHRIDSISKVHVAEKAKLDAELKETLQIIMNDYKAQIKEQKEINEKINNAIRNNSGAIRRIERDN
jgi:hypothetical protein